MSDEAVPAISPEDAEALRKAEPSWKRQPPPVLKPLGGQDEPVARREFVWPGQPSDAVQQNSNGDSSGSGSGLILLGSANGVPTYYNFPGATITDQPPDGSTGNPP